MSKTNRGNRVASTTNNGGTMTKIDGEAASVAPEGQTAEQPAEVAAEIAASGDTTGTEPVTEEAPAEQKADVTVVKDPFADLPVLTVGELENGGVQYRDLSDISATGVVDSDPRKYEGVHKAAKEQKLPVRPKWKHMADMLVLGNIRKEHRAGSVYGDIEQIIQAHGRAGVPAYVVAVQLRQKQIGNKRSHYATAGLPPIGWAEGWIETFVSKGYAKVMAKKAPAISSELVEATAEGDAQAEQQAMENAKAA